MQELETAKQLLEAARTNLESADGLMRLMEIWLVVMLLLLTLRFIAQLLRIYRDDGTLPVTAAWVASLPEFGPDGHGLYYAGIEVDDDTDVAVELFYDPAHGFWIYSVGQIDLTLPTPRNRDEARLLMRAMKVQR